MRSGPHVDNGRPYPDKICTQMAIRQSAVRAVPTSFPPAHLFLDDVEQLTAILLSTVKRDNYGHVTVQPKYIVGASTQCDSIEDLKSLGGRHDLEKQVSDTTLDINSHGASLYAYGMPADQRWALYGQLEAIFLHRSRPLKNSVEALERSSIVLLLIVWLLLCSVPLVVLAILGKRPGTVYQILKFTYWVLLFISAYKFGFQHSVVELRYAHEAASWRGKWKSAQPYVLVALGAVLGAVLGPVAQRIIKAIWP